MSGLIRAGLGFAVFAGGIGCEVEEFDEPRDFEMVEVSELGPASEAQPEAVEAGLVDVVYEDEAEEVVAGCSASAGSCTCFGDHSCGSWTDDDGHEHALCYDDAAKTEGTKCFAGANGGDCACSPIEKKPKPKPVEGGGGGG